VRRWLIWLKLRPVEVAELIEQTLAACQTQIIESGCRVEKEVASNLPPVMADAAALRHALQNLLSNALKYGGEGRWVKLAAQAQTGEQGTEVSITVEDRGLGIPPSDLPHIFEPFYRGREVVAAQIRGNGLGLSLVKHIVEAHRGRVSVTSAPGRGSAFTVHLPAATQTDDERSELTEESYGQAHFARGR
jgi:signal transduction histidine kinase